MSSVGLATATGTATGNAYQIAKGAAHAVATTTGVGLFAVKGSSAAVSTATGNSRRIAVGAGHAVATTMGVGNYLVRGSASAVATTTGVGNFLVRGSASAVAVTAGFGAAISASAGSAQAVATSLGNSYRISKGAAAASATSAAHSVYLVAGAAHGTGAAHGVGRFLSMGSAKAVATTLGHTFVTARSTGSAQAHTEAVAGGTPTYRYLVVPASQIADAQQTQGDAIIKLFQVDFFGGSSVYLSADNTFTWNGLLWEGIGLQITGEASYGDDQVSRPKLSIQNPNGAFSLFMSQLAFDGAVITCFRILKSDLLDNNPVYTSQVWQVGRVLSGNRMVIVLELRSFADAPNYLIPAQTYAPPKYPTVSLS